jgi:hypothetical protein
MEARIPPRQQPRSLFCKPVLIIGPLSGVNKGIPRYIFLMIEKRHLQVLKKLGKNLVLDNEEIYWCVKNYLNYIVF